MTSRTSRRPLIILGIVAGVVLIAALVVFLLMQRNAQTAAAPSSSSPTASASARLTATPTPTATPTETATPTDVVPRAAEVVMAATGFTMVADDGATLLAFRWRDEVEPAVAALSEAFGAEPELSVYPGNHHDPSYTIYDWRGFTLYDMIETPGGKPRPDSAVPTRASLTANEVGGVTLTPEFGLAIGMDVDATRAAGPDEEYEFQHSGGGLRFSFDIARTGQWPEPDSTHDLTYSVFAETGSEATHVTTIDYAPYSEL